MAGGNFDWAGYQRLLALRQSQRCDFPSPLHELAWEIAEHLGEPYAFWVRTVKKSHLHLGQVRHEFDVLRGKQQFTLKQKTRMLMATLTKRRKA